MADTLTISTLQSGGFIHRCSNNVNLYYSSFTEKEISNWANIIQHYASTSINLIEVSRLQDFVPTNYNFRNAKLFEQVCKVVDSFDMDKMYQYIMCFLLTLDSCNVELMPLSAFQDYQPTGSLTQINKQNQKQQARILSMEIHELREQNQILLLRVEQLVLAQREDLQKLEQSVNENQHLKSRILESKTINAEGIFITNERGVQAVHDEVQKLQELVMQNCEPSQNEPLDQALQRHFTDIAQCSQNMQISQKFTASRQFRVMQSMIQNSDALTSSTILSARDAEVQQSQLRLSQYQQAFQSQQAKMQQYFDNPQNLKFVAVFCKFVTSLQQLAQLLGIDKPEECKLQQLVESMRAQFLQLKNQIQAREKQLEVQLSDVYKANSAKEQQQIKYLRSLQEEFKDQVKTLSDEKKSVENERLLLEKKNLILKREIGRVTALLNQEFDYAIGSDNESFYESTASIIQTLKQIIDPESLESKKSIQMSIVELVNDCQNLEDQLGEQLQKVEELQVNIVKQDENDEAIRQYCVSQSKFEQQLDSFRSQNLKLNNLNSIMVKEADSYKQQIKVQSDKLLQQQQKIDVLELNIAQIQRDVTKNQRKISQQIIVNEQLQEINQLKVQLASVKNQMKFRIQPQLELMDQLYDKITNEVLKFRVNFQGQHDLVELLQQQFPKAIRYLSSPLAVIQFIFDEFHATYQTDNTVANILSQVQQDNLSITTIKIDECINTLQNNDESIIEQQKTSQQLIQSELLKNKYQKHLATLEQQFRNYFPEEHFDVEKSIGWMMEQFQLQMQQTIQTNNEYVQAINDVFQAIREETGLDSGELNLQQYVNEVLYEFRVALGTVEGYLLAGSSETQE